MGSVEERRRSMGTDADRLTEVREGFARSEFHRTFLGAQLERVTNGEVDVSLLVETRHLNLAGTLHGGLIRNPGRHGHRPRLPDDARGGDDLPHELPLGDVPATGTTRNGDGEGAGGEARNTVRLRGGGRRGR